jgi:sugar phosphate isomerase/epimerase
MSMNEMTTYRWSFEQDVLQFAAAGYTGIGVWRQKLADFGEERGIRLLREHNLQVSNLLWAGGFTGSDGRTYRESLRDAHEAIRLAAALRAECLIVYSGARGGHTRNHARRLAQNAIVELIPHAEEFGVTLAIEPMHDGCGADWTFLSDLDETLALLDDLHSPCVQLALDTYHLCEEPMLLSRVEKLARRVAVVHLGDTKHPPRGGEQDRCRLGEGELPLKEIVTILTDSGYRGFFDVELMGEEIEGFSYAELLAHSKEALDQIAGASSAG